jgi:hypothetical protein
MKPIKYLLFIFLFSNLILAQNGGILSFPDARSVAMGSQSAVTATGVYSILANPANLTLQSTNFEISTVFPLPSMNAATGNDFMSFNEFDYYFGGVTDAQGTIVGRYLDETEKATLLSKFSDGNKVQTSTALNLFSVSYSAGKEIGSFGFSIDDIVGQRTGLPIDLLDLFLNGNEVGRTYNLDDMVFSTSYLREYSLSYARDFSSLFNGMFKSFSGGITLKMVHGYAYSEIETVGTTITTNEDHSILIKNNFAANLAVSPDFGIEWDWDNRKRVSNVSPFLSPAGTGLGINLGFAAELDSIWTFGLSITDIGSVNWNNEPVSYKANGSFLISDLSDSTLSDSIQAALEPIGSYSDGFTSQLPTVLRLGASFRLDRFLKGNFPGEMLLVFGYNQGFNNSLNNTTDPMISLGCEWKPVDVVQLRTGLVFGGFQGFAWSLGLGIDAGIVEFNIATADAVSSIQGNDTQLIQFTIGSRWKF